MQTKILAIAAAALLAWACMDLGEPYNKDTHIYTLTVKALYPEGTPQHSGASVVIEDINGALRYNLKTGADATVKADVPNGLFRITVKEKGDGIIFSATRNNVLVSGENKAVEIALKQSKAGSVVVKEIYCGGCSKYPKAGEWAGDQYVIIHNNAPETQYLDGLCMGTLSPYNATATNNWLLDGEIREDIVPIAEAVLMMPGSGNDFPLNPGEDAVIVIRGAVDHTVEYPLSVNLNRPDYFVCYNPTFFPNTTNHPVPGDQISPDRHLIVAARTGQANSYVMSQTSPAFVLFRPIGTDIYTYVNDPVHTLQVKSDRVTAVPTEWIQDAVEVFDGSRSGNKKRLTDVLDAGYVTLTETGKGHTLMRKTDASVTEQNGYEYLKDTNNSSEDFYERETQSLHQ